jgi:hypothetical protein
VAVDEAFPKTLVRISRCRRREPKREVFDAATIGIAQRVAAEAASGALSQLSALHLAWPILDATGPVTPAQPTPIAESTPFDSWQRPLATAPNVEAVVLSIVARLTGDGRMDPAWSFLGEGLLDLESNQGGIAGFGASECIEDRTERELDLCCVDGLRLSAEQLTLQALEFDLAVRQALRHGTRTAGSIIEHARSVGVRPSVVTSGRQPENSQRRRQRHGFAGTFDRAEQAAFARCVWNACSFDFEAGDAEQDEDEDEPHDRREHRDSTFEMDDAIAQRRLSLVGVERDDVADAAANPAERGAARRGIRSSGNRSGFPVRTICSLMRWS